MFASLFEEMLHAHPSHRWIHAAGSEKTSKKMKEHLLHVKDERAKYLTTWLFGDSRRTSDGPVEAEPSLASMGRELQEESRRGAAREEEE